MPIALESGTADAQRVLEIVAAARSALEQRPTRKQLNATKSFHPRFERAASSLLRSSLPSDSSECSAAAAGPRASLTPCARRVTCAQSRVSPALVDAAAPASACALSALSRAPAHSSDHSQRTFRTFDRLPSSFHPEPAMASVAPSSSRYLSDDQPSYRCARCGAHGPRADA